MRKPWQDAGLAVLAVIAVIAWLAVLRPTAAPANAGAAPPVTLPSHATLPAALWVGDSYTAGVGSTSKAAGEACLTSAALKWRCELDAEGGTGFVNDGHVNSATYAPLISRLPADVAAQPKPAVVVVDAGRNDGSLPPEETEQAASAYYDALAKAYPDVPVVLIAPYFMASDSNAFSEVRGWMKTEGAKRGWKVIDPISEGWIESSTAAMTISDHVHPTPAGHAYLAQHLSADLKDLGIT